MPQEEDSELRDLDLCRQSFTWLALRLSLRQNYLTLLTKFEGRDFHLVLEEIKAHQALEQAKSAQEEEHKVEGTASGGDMQYEVAKKEEDISMATD